MNGNGIPVIGIKPIVMPAFSRIWNAHILMIPAATRLPYKSIEEAQTLKHAISSARYSPISTRAPMNPPSSPSTAKMKSVWRSGRKLPAACEPLPRPLPESCPEPIEIIDCFRL